jgi:excisionase family DNA binding protein
MTLVTIADAAKILGVSTQTLRSWDAKGILRPEYRTAGGHRRYSMEQLLQFRQSAQ